jgi:CTP-dependent riboflavin kinase
MYMYSGKRVTGSEIYNKALVYAHYSGGPRIREAISSLKNRQYITKQGVSTGATYQITPIGKHIIDEILDKYAIKA